MVSSSVVVDVCECVCFNGHPPLGVNATKKYKHVIQANADECFNGHPPLGVNATSWCARVFFAKFQH